MGNNVIAMPPRAAPAPETVSCTPDLDIRAELKYTAAHFAEHIILADALNPGCIDHDVVIQAQLFRDVGTPVRRFHNTRPVA